MSRLISRLFCTMIFMIGFACTSAAFAAGHDTREQAVAMVKKAIAYMKENGREKTIAAINSRKGEFIDGDLYVVIYDMNGKNIAHGANRAMVGKDLLDMTDVNGKHFMKERIELARSQGSGWQDYAFPNPVSKAIEPKSMYIEKYDDLIFGCGIYKK